MANDKIGFIGLGIMGLPMARNLIKAGFGLTVFDLDEARVQALAAEGAAQAASARDLAAACDVVIAILPDTPDVDAVLFGPNGVAGGLAAGKLVVDMSSVSPAPRSISPPASARSAAPISTRRSPAASRGPFPASSPSWSAGPRPPSTAPNPCSTPWGPP